MNLCCRDFYSNPLVELFLGPVWHPGGIELTRRIARESGFRGRLLDVACGSGRSAETLQREFALQVVGLDARPSSGAPRFVRGEAERLPFREGSFDGALVECALSTFADQPRALREIRRVLARDGMLALSDMIVDGPLPAELDGAVASIACLARAHSRAGYESLLRESGFRVLGFEDRADDLRALLHSIDSKLSPLAIDSAARILSAARASVDRGILSYGWFLAQRTSASA
jgi:SAM-dependent methyltransferase